MSFREWLKKFLTFRKNGITLDTMSNVREILREIIRKKGPIRKVAQEMGFDHGNLIRMLREGENPTIKTVERIADRLGYCLTIRRKGVKEKRSIDTQVDRRSAK